MTINNNTRFNVPKYGIQIARSLDSDVTIADNTINAIFAESKVRGGENVTDNLKGAISISSSSDVTIKDNIVIDSKNGVLSCLSDCDANIFKSFPDEKQGYGGTSSATVNGNSFVSITTDTMINFVPSYMFDIARNYSPSEQPHQMLDNTWKYFAPEYATWNYFLVSNLIKCQASHGTILLQRLATANYFTTEDATSSYFTTEDATSSYFTTEDATSSYFTTEETHFAEILFGCIQYSPFCIDKDLQLFLED